MMAPVAGWYDDPMTDSAWRWWDGGRWTEQSRSKDQPLVSLVPTHAPPTHADAVQVAAAHAVDAQPSRADVAPTLYLVPDLAPEVAEEPELVIYDEPAPIHLEPIQPQYAEPTNEVVRVPVQLTPQAPPMQAAPTSGAASASASAPSGYFADEVVSVVVTPEPALTVSGSTSVALRDPAAPRYPWDEAIAALSADNERFATASSATDARNRPVADEPAEAPVNRRSLRGRPLSLGAGRAKPAASPATAAAEAEAATPAKVSHQPSRPSRPSRPLMIALITVVVGGLGFGVFTVVTTPGLIPGL